MSLPGGHKNYVLQQVLECSGLVRSVGSCAQTRVATEMHSRLNRRRKHCAFEDLSFKSPVDSQHSSGSRTSPLHVRFQAAAIDLQ